MARYMFDTHYGKSTVVDTENGIQVEWDNGDFNGTQKVTYTGGSLDAQEIARLARELGDYVAKNYPELVRAATIQEQLRQRRVEQGMSLRDMEAASGITYSTLCKIEGGYWNPALGTIEKMCEALGCHLEIEDNEKEGR